MAKTYQPAFFHAPELGTFAGFHDPSRNWNGWAIPFFPVHIAEQICKRFNETMNGEGFSDGTFSFVVNTKEGAWKFQDDFAEEIYECQTIIVEGKEERVFSIGGFSWTWSIAASSLDTELPESITSFQEAVTFLRALYVNNDSFHCEDDATDLVTFGGLKSFTQEEGEKLNKLMEQIYELPEFKGNMEYCPCAVMLDFMRADGDYDFND